MPIRIVALRAVALPLLLLATGCIAAWRSEARRASVSLGPIGRQLRVIDDPAATRYLERLGDTIAGVADDTATVWRFVIVDAPDAAAFATPSQIVFVTRGMVERMPREGAFAAVLAHEIAHVKLGHAADYARSTAAGTNPDSADAETARVLSCVLTRDCGDPAGDALYGILGNQNFARYAREQEAAVDGVAFGYLRGAGLNPQGYVELLDVLLTARERAPDSLVLWTATHPLTRPREEAMRKRLANQPRDLMRELMPELARIQRLDSREYQEFRRGLLARTTVASRAGSN
jgi:predicted Zn-dependent protease